MTVTIESATPGDLAALVVPVRSPEPTELAEPADLAGQPELTGLPERAVPAGPVLRGGLTARVQALVAELAGLVEQAGRRGPLAWAAAGGTDGMDAADTASAGDAANTTNAPDAADTGDAAWIDQIHELEALKSAACAVQACATASFADAQRAGQVRAGVARSRAGRGIASQIGLARRESPNKGQFLLGLATSLVNEMPYTLAALAKGELNEWRATIIVRETAILTREDRAAVDRELCGPGGNAASLGDAALARAARAIGQRLDPGAALARAQKAERERGVTIRPAPDCMVKLIAYLPVVHGVGVYAALSKAADAVIAAGLQGTNGRNALMADELITRVLPPASPAGPARPGTFGAPGAPAARQTVPEPPVEVQLIMTELTLFGVDEAPAHLTGYGPIPAPLARRIAAGWPTDGSEPGSGPPAVRWIRRLYQKPGTEDDPCRGLIAMDSRRREFPDGIRRFIVARDQFCRTPWCGALIRHIDHIDPAAGGGPTSAVNAQGLCEACNYAKEAVGWRQATVGSDGEVITTTPTGHQYVSSPPPPPGGTRRAAVPAQHGAAG